MEQGMTMPASQGKRKFGFGAAALTASGVVVVLVNQSGVKHKNSAVADFTTQLAAGDCSAADRSIVGPMGDGFANTFTGCAKYSVFSGWDSDGTAQCIADAIHISVPCAHCFSDAVGYAYDNCRSGDCSSDQCGEGCTQCLAPAKHTAELCVGGGEIVQQGYADAMHQSCRTGISGTVSADHCEADTGLACSSSDDCPVWSNSQCIEGHCQCNSGTCSVNGGECVAPGQCPKYTGGTCAYVGCNSIRNSECIGGWGAGLCMCSDDQCVLNGKCVPAR